jgi:hypothetical protein
MSEALKVSVATPFHDCPLKDRWRGPATLRLISVVVGGEVGRAGNSAVAVLELRDAVYYSRCGGK